MSPLLLALDSIGIFVFALSGALAAARKDMDIFGFAVLALMPAVGGGTLRDLLLDVPVFWVQETRPIWITGAAVLLGFFGARFVESRRQVIIWADAFGVSLFAVVGAQKALLVTGDYLIAVMLGVATGVAGGMIRDIIANEVPLILQKEVYATAAFAGAAAYCALAALGVPALWTLPAAVAVGFAVRASAILYGWSMPKPRA